MRGRITTPDFPFSRRFSSGDGPSRPTKAVKAPGSYVDVFRVGSGRDGGTGCPGPSYLWGPFEFTTAGPSKGQLAIVGDALQKNQGAIWLI